MRMFYIERKIVPIDNQSCTIFRRIVTPFFYIRLANKKVKFVQLQHGFVFINLGFYSFTHELPSNKKWIVKRWVDEELNQVILPELEEIHKSASSVISVGGES